MAGDQNFIARLPRQETLAVAQASICESGVNANFIITLRQSKELSVRKAEAPVLFVIRGSIRNPIGVRWNREEVWPDFA